jgi:NDP-sugar pyrophosphorylase family protein
VSLAGPSSRSNVLVLCAGRGTRLGLLSEALPKPLVPVGDRPQLEHVLWELGRQGFERVLVNTHHLAESFSGVCVPGVDLAISHEPELRGTAGAIGFARERLVAPLVVWNGDILAYPELGPLMARANSAGICLLARPVAPGQAGTLGLDQHGSVVRLRGERFADEQRAADYVGILGIGDEVLQAAPEIGCLVADLCLPWLRSGRPIPTLPYDGPWADIGSIAAYHQVNVDWLEQRQLASYTAPGARVARGVSLERSLVHEGASVEGSGALERCIVFTGARATAPLADAIVLRTCVVHVERCLTAE